MLAGEMGEPRRWAISHQLQVGHFFDADDFVPVTQAHIMGDTESLGESGVEFLEQLALAPAQDRRVKVPTITDPRGLDFSAYRRLKQTTQMADLERRASAAFEAFDVLMTNTCINYQTVFPATRGEHLAMGDTGVVIYSNSVLGARSNFEGGPSSLAAGLTGRTPRYGYHLDRNRRATRRIVVNEQPKDLSDWGALGAMVGKHANSYWEVPLVDGLCAIPNSDQLKHFGAALASFGSVALFHMPGITPECRTMADVVEGAIPEAVTVGRQDYEAFFASYAATGEKVDVVVFAAPQLSLFELQQLAGLIGDQRIHPDTSLLVATSPEIKSAADRMGLTARIEQSGAILLSGVCFYQSYAREMAEANGWKRLMSNSAKLINIIGGYGYLPTLATMERCVTSAIQGRIV
ncbi:MAG TPA: aconitase X catalytic domain-containing protein [Rhizomicrobium sp.]|nr:aconitase X catalytic domain-containing protein [Rhizomicrobium sp.]